MKHFLTLESFSVPEIQVLIERALFYKKTKLAPKLEHKLISNIFFENSTRTKISFEVAERKSGMEVIPFEVVSSSISKGETLYDTIKTLEAIGCDAVVIRSSENNYYEQLLGKINMPIINAGDGSHAHPSQSLLDLMTIYEHFGSLADKKIVIVGDVLHSRVAHSNIKVLQRLGAKIFIAAPIEWQDLTVEDVIYTELDAIIAKVDVVMLLRCQVERHGVAHDNTNFLAKYGLTVAREKAMRADAIIMHPAPVNRDVEIESSLVESAKSRIFEQMANGTYARMAILEMVFTK